MEGWREAVGGKVGQFPFGSVARISPVEKTPSAVQLLCGVVWPNTETAIGSRQRRSKLLINLIALMTVHCCSTTVTLQPALEYVGMKAMSDRYGVATYAAGYGPKPVIRMQSLLTDSAHSGLYRLAYVSGIRREANAALRRCDCGDVGNGLLLRDCRSNSTHHLYG